MNEVPTLRARTDTRAPQAASGHKEPGLISPGLLRGIGWFATATALCMFVSYVDQIRLNLEGHKGSVIMPAATVLNCSLWTFYGALRRDWPVAAGNFPGVILGAIAFVTAWF